MHPRLPSVQTNFPLEYGGATSEQEHLTSEWDFLAKVTDEGGGEFPTRSSHVWLFRDKTEVARSLGLRHLFSFVMGTRKGGTDPTEAAAASDVETTRCRPTQSPARARFPAQVFFRKMRIIFLYRLRP